jgi:hypothetical protein
MSVQLRTVGVTADLTIRVPRDRDEDLEDGARRLLRRVDAVTEVEAIDLQGVQPRLNDLAIEVRAELRAELDPPDDDPEAVEEVLSDGFGLTVDAVEAVG